MAGSLVWTDGDRYCASYNDGKKRAGVTGCWWRGNRCPHGFHACFKCGKSGHGAKDCRVRHALTEVSLAETQYSAFRTATRERRSVLPQERRSVLPERDSLAGTAVSPRGRPEIDAAMPATASYRAAPRPLAEYRGAEDLPIVWVWRPTEFRKHGYACLFQFACKMMHLAKEAGVELFIDLSSKHTLYESFTNPGTAANWWTDVFVQPYYKTQENNPASMKKLDDLLNSLREYDYKTSFAGVIVKDPPASELIWNSHGVWGPSRDNGLSALKVIQTRQLMEQFVQLSESFAQDLQAEAVQVGLVNDSGASEPTRALAVHLRLTDKIKEESPENAQLETPAIVKRITESLEAFQCKKVFLCTDDGNKKVEIKTALGHIGIPCATYKATLGKNPNVGLHFSRSVPKDVHTRDISIEVQLMAKYCKALLATRSNVPFMVAVLADEDFGVEDFFTGRLDMSAVPSASAPSRPPAAPPAEVFTTVDGEVEGMWVTGDILAIKVKNSKGHHLTRHAKRMLGAQLCLHGTFDSKVLESVAEWEARLGGFMDPGHYGAAVAKISDSDPERIGLAVAPNVKVRNASAALSILVVVLLDSRNQIQDETLASFCRAAAAKRPS